MENPSKKRTATRELNHDNWNDEDEPEDAGTFRQAPTEVIQTRVIRQARRRMTGNSDEGKPKVFSGFAGFGAASTPSSAAFSSFNFGKPAVDATAPSSTASFGPKTSSVESETPKKENGTAKTGSADNEENDVEFIANLTKLNKTVSTWITEHINKNPCCVLTPIFRDYEKHYEELEAKRKAKKAVNKSETPSSLNITNTSTFVNFKTGDESKPSLPVTTPFEGPKVSFSFGNGGSSSITPSKESTGNVSFGTGSSSRSSAAPTSTFSFSSANSSPSNSTTTNSALSNFKPGGTTLSFGFTPASSTSDSAPFTFKPGGTTLSFGSTPASSTTTTSSQPGTTPGLFSFGSANTFGSSKPDFGSSSTTTASTFSFGFSSKPAVTEKKEEEDKEAEGDDDEDQPPPEEVKPVKEDDAFYSIKCKLFYKKDATYAEKGVGMLHLKKMKEDKTQLVVRADTSLGNILLNIMLPPKMSITKQGKNNVMIVCIPNPPIDPKTPPAPTPMLLRVKTSEDADELIAKLTEATQ